MEKKQNVPALRFQGFSGEWKRQKFGEVATFINGRAYAQSELLSAGKYKVLRVGNFYTNSTWYYSNLELSDKYYANRGDLLYTWSATFGPHIWDGDKVIYHYHIWKIEVKEQLEKLFFLQLLERDKKNLLNDTNGSTMVHITKLGMENKTDFIPNNIDEQSKIGQFCSQINCKIEKEKRKIQKLQQFRQAMLTKLFPREGAAEPELRFRGFSGKWKSQKMKDLGSFLKGKLYSKKNIQTSGVPLILYGRLYTQYELVIDEVDTFAVPYENSVWSIGGEVIVPASGETAEDIAIASVVKRKGILLGGDLNIIRPNDTVSSVFLALSISYGHIHNELAKRAQGKSIVHIHNSDLVQLDIRLPSIEEQKAIGDFFYRLDRYISLQQKKLERMQRLKAALLEKLFV